MFNGGTVHLMKEIKIRVPDDMKDHLTIMAKKNNESLNEFLNNNLKSLIKNDQLTNVTPGIRRQLDEIAKTLEVLVDNQNTLQDMMLAMLGLSPQNEEQYNVKAH